jgi:hypothetical protein
MELKRILARDVKSANEKAVALYGNDVLVISSCQVRGQTELIVAVDIEPMPAELALQADEATPIVRAAPVIKQGPFAELLGHSMDQNSTQRNAPQRRSQGGGVRSPRRRPGVRKV